MATNFKVQKRLLFVISFFCFTSNYGQDKIMGGWYQVNFNYLLTQKFSLNAEVQSRSQKWIDDFYYRELKTGINYTFPGKQSIQLGYGNINTYSLPGNFEKPLLISENRLWEQFTMSHSIGRVKLDHRYRLEQRWQNGEFSSRLRYRLNTSISINHKSITDNTVYISASDELFFINKQPYFARNRIFAGAGFRFSSLVSLQAGIIHQFDYKGNDNSSGKNYFNTTLILKAGSTKREKP